MKEDTSIKLNYWTVLISSILIANCIDNIQLYSDVDTYYELSDILLYETLDDTPYIDVNNYDKTENLHTFFCRAKEQINLTIDRDSNLLIYRWSQIHKLNKINAIEWSYSYWLNDSNYIDLNINKIIHTRNDNYMVLCTAKKEFSPEENYDYNDLCLLKLKNNGTTDWFKFYKVYGDDIGVTIEELDDGYLIVGQINRPTSNKFPAIWIIKIDLNGSIIWQKLYEIDYLNNVKSIVKTRDNKFIILAQTEKRITATLLIKINERGDIEWAKEYKINEYIEPINILNHKNEEYIIGISINGSLLGLFTINKNGNPSSLSKYEFINNESTPIKIEMSSLTNDSEVGYLVSGGNSSGDFVIFNIDKEGNIIWSWTYDNYPIEIENVCTYNYCCLSNYSYGPYEAIPAQKNYYIFRMEYLFTHGGKGCDSISISWTYIIKFSKEGYFCRNKTSNEIRIKKVEDIIYTNDIGVTMKETFIVPSEKQFQLIELDEDLFSCNLCY